MKIAFLSDGIPPYVIGGMQKHSLSLASQLVRFGHDVDLYHCVYTDNELPSEEDVNNLAFNGNLRFNKVHCSYFPTSIYFPGHYIWNSYRYSRHIYDNLVKDLNSYDFVYAKGFSAWKLFIKTNKKKNHPKIGLKFHGYEMFQSAPSIKVKIQHYLLRPFVKWQNRQADFIFSYGGKISEIIKSLNITENKIIEIPSSINEKWIISNLTQKGSKLKFLFIGRYERRKGIEELNDAIDSLSDRKITAEFHFVGNIPKDKQLKSKNLDIYYHGVVTDELSKIKIIDFCDVLICPSYAEGMPNVILEAMSRGLAIIATDVGAISIMVDKSNGVLLKSNNPKEIINSVINIIDKKSTLNNLKLSSIQKVKKGFTFDFVIKKLINSIEKSIN